MLSERAGDDDDGSRTLVQSYWVCCDESEWMRKARAVPREKIFQAEKMLMMMAKNLFIYFIKISLSLFYIFYSPLLLLFCSYKVNGRISWRLNGTCNDKHVGLDGLQCQRYETNAISTHPETKATRSLHTGSSEFLKHSTHFFFSVLSMTRARPVAARLSFFM